MGNRLLCLAARVTVSSAWLAIFIVSPINLAAWLLHKATAMGQDVALAIAAPLCLLVAAIIYLNRKD